MFVTHSHLSCKTRRAIGAIIVNLHGEGRCVNPMLYGIIQTALPDKATYTMTNHRH